MVNIITQKKKKVLFHKFIFKNLFSLLLLLLTFDFWYWENEHTKNTIQKRLSRSKCAKLESQEIQTSIKIFYCLVCIIKMPD